MMKKLILTSFLLLMSLAAQAVQDIGKINRVYVFKTSYGFNMGTGFPTASAEYGCEAAWGFARIESESAGNTNSKEMYSAILTAFAANKTVKVNVDGCVGKHFRVSGIYVED
ncbi:hypothetical protein [Alteromonas sp. ASW11-130]|uniref:hypothetical protein n=1 Tax=Alteromonas sp. ASW11-130 TaxID=3015775 RepID=UPI0022422432|nr:hypothetical protein [Alteromonas sp. ASW11-130]MCW8091131.1 hypothetical protein [Alteromonas sp. ASW11-130]